MVCDASSKGCAVTLLRVNGVECTVQCSQQVASTPLQTGAVLTVKHSGFHPTGALKFPFLWRERKDISWEELTKAPKQVAVAHGSPFGDSNTILEGGEKPPGVLRSTGSISWVQFTWRLVQSEQGEPSQPGDAQRVLRGFHCCSSSVSLP